VTPSTDETSLTIRRLVGDRPPCPPALVRLRSEDLPWGLRTLIEYQTEPDERTQAYLLEPKPSVRLGIGVLAAHQHNGEWQLGKSEPAGVAGNPDCHYGRELCERGYTVICPDYLGFEDRGPSHGLRPYENTPKDRAWEEMDFCVQLMRGSSLCAKYIFDSCQALDVLEQLGSVRGGHLGVIGHSLGGQTAMWTAFYDPRVKAAFSSCSLSLIATILEQRINHNLAAFLPGLLRCGDIDDVVAAIAPRAFGMSSGREDGMFPVSGVEAIHRKAETAFPAGQFLGLLFPGAHSFPVSIRNQAYDLLDRHLRT
jgi:dienelactone hydrolase